MPDKIVLAGGAGYLGHVLADYYKNKAKEIVILSRRKENKTSSCSRTVVWDAQNRGDWEKELDGADMVVNLCGKNVNCRYTEEG